jgi:acid phosphatase
MKPFFLILVTGLTLWSCTCNQIVNLRTAKDIVKDYYESGKYDEETNKIVKDAEEKFDNIKVDKSAKGRSVVIFDVDDTALNNYGLAKSMDFGYVYDLNKKWNKELKAPAIEQTKDLYFYLLNKGFKVIFLTGRNSSEYDVTYQNLIKDGYTGFDTLITQREDEQNLKAAAFKIKKRTELTDEGYDIIGTVGDQWTDLEGPYTGIKIKLPNYLYEIK